MIEAISITFILYLINILCLSHLKVSMGCILKFSVYFWVFMTALNVGLYLDVIR